MRTRSVIAATMRFFRYGKLIVASFPGPAADL